MNGTIDIEHTIGNAASEFPALHRLFGGYFHQDWRDEHATPDAAAVAFRQEASRSTQHEAFAELERLRHLPLKDDDLGRLLAEGFDCNYLPRRDGLSNAAWLEVLMRTLHAPQA